MDLYRYVYGVCRGFYFLRCWGLQHLTPMGWGVLGMAIASGLVGLKSSQSLCHLLFFLSVALLGLAFAGRRFVQLSFQIERILPSFGTVGQPLGYRIVLKSLSAQSQVGLQLAETIPIEFLTFAEFLQIRSRVGMGRQWWWAICESLEKRQWAIAPMTEVPKINPRGTTEITAELFPLRRGRLDLNNLAIITTDPLGLCYQRVTCAEAQSVCVLPQQYQLPSLFSVTHQARQRGVMVLTPRVGESLEFRALRDYRPGDPINKIHWRSWAKIGRPIVKEQQDESSVHHGLVLDTFYPESESDVFEVMLAIATSILTQIELGSARLDVIFANHSLQYVTTRAGSRQSAMLLELVATMNPSQTFAFNDLIPLVQSRLAQLSSCICLFIQWDQPRQTLIEMLAQTDIPTKAIVLCEGQQNHQGLRYLSFGQVCTVYFISIDQVQQNLLQL